MKKKILFFILFNFLLSNLAFGLNYWFTYLVRYGTTSTNLSCSAVGEDSTSAFNVASLSGNATLELPWLFTGTATAKFYLEEANTNTAALFKKADSTALISASANNLQLMVRNYKAKYIRFKLVVYTWTSGTVSIISPKVIIREQ